MMDETTAPIDDADPPVDTDALLRLARRVAASKAALDRAGAERDLAQARWEAARLEHHDRGDEYRRACDRLVRQSQGRGAAAAA